MIDHIYSSSEQLLAIHAPEMVVFAARLLSESEGVQL